MKMQGTPQRHLQPGEDFDWQEYELEYWRKRGMKLGGRKNLQYLQYFQVPKEYKDQTIIDIGCGPFGGVLPFLKAGRRIVVEPLYKNYCNEGFWKANPEIEVCACFAEQMDLTDSSVHAAFACNSLDHGESILHALHEVARVLVAGGRFFLHVHCRSRRQLNEGHRQSFGPGSLLVMARDAGLICKRWQVYHRDPINGQYKAFIGKFQKPVKPISPASWWEKTRLRLEGLLRRPSK